MKGLLGIREACRPLLVGGLVLMVASGCNRAKAAEVAPGSSLLCGECIAPGVDTLLVTMRNGGGERRVDMIVLNTSIVTRGGESFLVRSERSTGNARSGAVSYTDSFVVNRSTLAPSAAFTSSAGDVRRFYFSPGKMDVVAGATPLKPTEVPLKDAVFYLNSIDLVVGALKLSDTTQVRWRAVGDEVLYPLWVYASPKGPAVFRAGDNSVCEATTVRAEYRGASMLYFLNKRTRRVAAIRIGSEDDAMWFRPARCPR
jgi:hypothetical protein